MQLISYINITKNNINRENCDTKYNFLVKNNWKVIKYKYTSYKYIYTIYTGESSDHTWKKDLTSVPTRRWNRRDFLQIIWRQIMKTSIIIIFTAQLWLLLNYIQVSITYRNGLKTAELKRTKQNSLVWFFTARRESCSTVHLSGILIPREPMNLNTWNFI